MKPPALSRSITQGARDVHGSRRGARLGPVPIAENPTRALPQPRDPFNAPPPEPQETTMGWLYQRDPVDDPLAYITAKYSYDCETHILKTLDGARAGNTVYLAVRSTD